MFHMFLDVPLPTIDNPQADTQLPIRAWFASSGLSLWKHSAGAIACETGGALAAQPLNAVVRNLIRIGGRCCALAGGVGRPAVRG
jgi:hypothetical protein